MEPGCGNKACACGRQCGCPYGACSCDREEEDDEEELDLSNDTEVIININIGVMGHVNSGKTSLVRALSRTLSTAALDGTHKPSKQRGMTLDLGFSSFQIQAPNSSFRGVCDKLQYTLVDCPGHSSLIKTIINGAQIIDRMLLVLDVTKGIQLQTAECLILGEILTNDLVIVLNKIDLLVPAETRAEQVQLAIEQLRKHLAPTPFANSIIVPVAACVDGGGDENLTKVKSDSPLTTHNLVDLVRAIRDTSVPPQRLLMDSPLLFTVDRLVASKGQGAMLTGTILSGTARVGDEIELKELGGGEAVRKIKQIQCFHRIVQSAAQGDRCSLVVRYFDHACESGSKLHVTVGMSTVPAKVTFFGSHELMNTAKQLVGRRLPLDCLSVLATLGNEYEFDGELKASGKQAGGPVLQFALIEFDQAVACPAHAQVIGTRLDLNSHGSSSLCRLAMYGRVCRIQDSLPPVRLFTYKEKRGVVDRVSAGEVELIGKGMFKKDEDMSAYLNLGVVVEEDKGVLESSFGKTGKFKINFRSKTKAKPGDAIVLRFKQYLDGGNNNGRLAQ
ncbi:hypothetical protein BASA81_002681 [Batrachochytrium salamandrivorans]|nr:hypothetical protein BASA81_002681 [Batrachochytrium salamandrivorans]